MITVEELKIMLTTIESDRVEKTISVENRDKFGEAICAFANDYPNHNQKGFLLIGVKKELIANGGEKAIYNLDLENKMLVCIQVHPLWKKD